MYRQNSFNNFWNMFTLDANSYGVAYPYGQELFSVSGSQLFTPIFHQVSKSLIDISFAEPSPLFATITGTSGDDVLTGTSGDDVINGLAGNDQIFGSAGADVLYGGAGNDFMRGNAGDDELYGGDGDDELFGDGGTDILDGGAGNDILWGGDGDTAIGGDGNDRFLTNGGVTTFDGGTGDDIAEFLSNIDGMLTFSGGDGSDTLFFQNRIIAGNTDTTMQVTFDGGNGIDIFQTQRGFSDFVVNAGANGALQITHTDTLRNSTTIVDLTNVEIIRTAFQTVEVGEEILYFFGGETQYSSQTITRVSVDIDPFDFVLGPRVFVTTNLTDNGDVFRDANGPGIINGGAGNDDIRGNSGADIINGGAGDDRINGGAHGDILNGGDGADRIVAGSGDDMVEGGDGDDLIYGVGGEDYLFGGAGDDVIYGNAKADVLFGDAGNDRLDGGGAGDQLFGGDGDDDLFGGGGKDVLSGGSGQDILDGGAAADLIYGGGDGDHLIGGGGNDRLYGQSGNDILDGGIGHDFLDGGTSSDELSGGAGNDYLVGGWTIEINDSENDDDTIIFSNDSLDGGAGDDRLVGQGGSNQLTGGAGRDTFVAMERAGAQEGFGGSIQNILDFAQGEDLVEIDAGFYVDFTTMMQAIPTSTSGVVDLSDAGGDYVQIAYGDVRYKIYNVTRAELQASDFSFVTYGAAEIPEIEKAVVAEDLAVSEIVEESVTEAEITLTHDDNIHRDNAQGNTISGLGGDDFIRGNDGADIIGGGTGADQFNIGSTVSAVIWDFASGVDHITFEKSENIQSFSDILDIAFVGHGARGTYVVINFGGPPGSHIQLFNMTLDDLVATDFTFVDSLDVENSPVHRVDKAAVSEDVVSEDNFDFVDNKPFVPVSEDLGFDVPEIADQNADQIAELSVAVFDTWLDYENVDLTDIDLTDFAFDFYL